MRFPTVFNRISSGTGAADPLKPQARPDVMPTCAMPSRTTGQVDGLSQYLENRGREHRAVSPISRGMLERGTEAVDTVRKQIPMRGNVRTDLDQTEQQAAHRLYASRYPVTANMRMRLNSGHKLPLPELKAAVISAASARVTGAGNCDEFQSAALLAAGKKLRQGERLVATVNDAKDHTFVQMESQRPDGTMRVVVLDAWANGPAILAEDCAYAQMNPKMHIGEVTDRVDAIKADRIATNLVKAHNKDSVSLAALQATLERQHSKPSPGGFIYDELHVSGQTLVAPGEDL